MTMPTATEQPWLATDLANVADDVKLLRRHVYHLVADCFLYTADRAVCTVRDLVAIAPKALSARVSVDQSLENEYAEHISYRSLRLFGVFATGFGLALLLRRAR